MQINLDIKIAINGKYCNNGDERCRFFFANNVCVCMLFNQVSKEEGKFFHIRNPECLKATGE